MSKVYVTRFGLWVPALALIGLAAATAAGVSEPAKAGPGSGLGCEISVARSGGMVELKALVSAPRDTSGSYRLTVEKSGGGGGASIDQSGGFTVSGGAAEVVSGVSLGGGGRYTARLTVTADGATVACSERVGGAI